MRRAVTIKHVAAEAGVSLQTVSRVMNNEPNVRPVVQERVRAAVAKLGYVPSLAARRMGGSRSYLLMALNDRDRTIEGWKSGEGTDWVDQMLMGGMLKCEAHGYRMIFELVDTHSDHVDAAVRGAIAALHPDGVILTPPHSENPAITGLLSQLGLPFARIASIAEGDGFAVSMDDAKAAAFAAEHLLSLGHTRIGFITGSEEYAVSGARLAGYRQVMSASPRGLDETLIGRGDFTYESGVVAMDALLALPTPPTAVVASNDRMAHAALRTAQARGLSVPADLSVISFDNTPLARFADMSAIVQPIAEMSAVAADLLIRFKSGDPDLPAQSMVEFGFAPRGSTAPPKA
ncbi:LacI family DNA-binding transcriptional regulator [Brevundimonas sp.]|uniref:LacI family DNA-binding transcriptional regulator n=1 Tax=Brevundimonas sp. TaxID=1871086 RepID=UPI0037C05CFA